MVMITAMAGYLEVIYRDCPGAGGKGSERSSLLVEFGCVPYLKSQSGWRRQDIAE